MSRRQLPPPVRSLDRLSVVITGRLDRNGEWVKRDEARRLARQAGARLRPVRARASYDDDLLVIGSSALWKYGEYGTQEERVLEFQEQGSSIEIIDQDGFFALIEGGWAYPLSRHVDPVDYPEAFLPYRPVDPDIEIAGYAWETTGRALSQAATTHRRLQERVAQHLDELGFVPLTPAWSDCAFDVAWQDEQGTFHVVEIKSLNRISTLRLGIGQVLDYATTLRTWGHEVVPHVLLAAAPDETDHWLAVAATAGIRMSWTIEELLAVC